MRKDNRLPRMVHVILHMASEDKTFTSEDIAKMLDTNAVVVRRTMTGLKNAGLVKADKGPGGGWKLIQSLDSITLYDIYLAVGEPTIFAIGNENNQHDCVVKVVVNQVLEQAFSEAQDVLINTLKSVTLAKLSEQFRVEGNTYHLLTEDSDHSFKCN